MYAWDVKWLVDRYDAPGERLAFHRKEGWFVWPCELSGTEYAGVDQVVSERSQPCVLKSSWSSCSSGDIYVAVVLTPVVKLNGQRTVS
jgi:hypothetical protein